jgi:uncharacterized membrane protein HdeD (DUF308 family)
MTTIVHPVLDMFLLGFIAGTAFAACLFFLRFWKDTRDSLFLAFAGFFGLMAVSETLLLNLPQPNQGNPWLFLVRLASILIVIAAILRKNSARC